MLFGLLIQGAGLLWLGLAAQPGVGYGTLVLPLIVAGIGISMVFPTVANAVVGSVPITESGVAAGTNNTVRESGGVFGVAILSAVFAANGGYQSAAVFMHGFRHAEIIAAVAAAAGAVVAVFAPNKAQADTAAAQAGGAAIPAVPQPQGV
jgi:hypothetical protein